jgi:hypothetical protein
MRHVWRCRAVVVRQAGVGDVGSCPAWARPGLGDAERFQHRFGVDSDASTHAWPPPLPSRAAPPLMLLPTASGQPIPTAAPPPHWQGARGGGGGVAALPGGAGP